MPDLGDGPSVEIRGSARAPYVLKNVGGVYSCSCPAWRNQSLPIERRTCKHLRQYRGAVAEATRIDASSAPVAELMPTKPKSPALLLAEGEGVAVMDKASGSSSSAADRTEKVLTSSSA